MLGKDYLLYLLELKQQAKPGYGGGRKPVVLEIVYPVLSLKIAKNAGIVKTET